VRRNGCADAPSESFPTPSGFRQPENAAHHRPVTPIRSATFAHTVCNNCTAADATSGLAGCVVTGYTAIVGTHQLTATATDVAGTEDTIEEIVGTGGTGLRYDSTGQQFIQNWKTPAGAGACYRVTVTLIDDTAQTALFKLK
jgi:hypothetical protein